MATYKVLQDIEAEDKLVGPLTLRQFLYAITCIVCLYICLVVVTKHAAYFMAIFLPPALIFGFFAFPWGREQPTEIWALAKVRFMLKPRRRIWDQSGVKELVTVTAPKRVDPIYTNGLSETEVTSRLKALADTLDSRGWVVKDVDAAHMNAALSGASTAESDRLLGLSATPQAQSDGDIQPAEDMLDEKNSPIARQFDQMIEKSNVEHRERIKQEMSRADAPTLTPAPKATASSKPASPPNDYWFLGQVPTTGPAQVVTPNEPASAVPAAVAAAEPTAAEKALAHRLKQQNKDSIQISYGHMRTIQPLLGRPQAAQSATQSATQKANDDADAADAQAKEKTTSATVTRQPNPGTLKYVNNNDLTVATIARQVNENPPDEIVISLH
ncbi:MAG TPA: PrgI family protein [Candidatus Saccharimonadales bacterium]|jgi:hypothetical protein